MDAGLIEVENHDAPVVNLRPGDLLPKLRMPRTEQEIIARWINDPGFPLVSVLCITYNHEDYIEDALNGFLNQDTIFPFEIIVHDDASLDRTAEIVEHYARDYPRIIKVILQTENKYSQGYNPFIFIKNVCKGKYCALCEGDDYWLSENKLSRQVEALELNSDVKLSIHPAIMVDVTTDNWVFKYHKGNQERCLSANNAVAAASQFSPTASYLFKRDEFLKMPSWFFEAKDLPFGDYFVESIIGRGGILYLPDVFCVYRRNVVGSYTDRSRSRNRNELLSRMRSILYYTKKLESFPEIEAEAIFKRIKNVYSDYLRMAISRRDFEFFRSVIDQAHHDGYKIAASKVFASKGRASFRLYLLSLKMVSLLKGRIARFRRRKINSQSIKE